MKCTPWFDGSVRPFHKGVYPRRFTFYVLYSYWNGRYWGYSEHTLKDAYRLRMLKSSSQKQPWRGLTKPAKA